jgi:transcription initiation factor TFIID subunit TAF12
MNVSVGGVNLNLNANTTVQTTSATTHQVLQQQQPQQQLQQQQLNQNTVNCTQTMNRLEAFKAELKDQSFEDDRLEALQLGLQKTCLNTGQAEQLLDLFTFDDNRLAVAKYLSDRLIDRENAGVLAKKLTFESNKMDYRRYISE